jgi:putative transposase
LKSFPYTGCHVYSLRFCTESRRQVFIARPAVDLVLSQLLRAASACEMEVLAYCFMPDHVHLVVTGSASTSDAQRFIRLAKQFSGFAYARWSGARLWQRYSFERVLRSDEPTRDVVQYVLANPVRAGLVARIQDYPFLGSATQSLDEILASLAE